MTKLLKSVVRIVMTVAVILGVIVLALAMALRQPNVGSAKFPGSERASLSALESHVRFLASPEHPRNSANPAGLERAAEYISRQLRDTSARVSDQPFTIDRLHTRNVIARFGPEEGPRIVVGAHYDACGPVPAADDNASGVAGLLELARLLQSQKLFRPIELVASPRRSRLTSAAPPWVAPCMHEAWWNRVRASAR
jgi:hypothetical protein